jgi:hypothetical protein
MSDELTANQPTIITSAIAREDCAALALLFKTASDHGVWVPLRVGNSLARFVQHLDKTDNDYAMTSLEQAQAVGGRVFDRLVVEAVREANITENDILTVSRDAVDHIRIEFGLLVTQEDLLQAVRARPPSK